jgi:hypothetical protein
MNFNIYLIYIHKVCSSLNELAHVNVTPCQTNFSLPLANISQSYLHPQIQNVFFWPIWEDGIEEYHWERGKISSFQQMVGRKSYCLVEEIQFSGNWIYFMKLYPFFKIRYWLAFNLLVAIAIVLPFKNLKINFPFKKNAHKFNFHIHSVLGTVQYKCTLLQEILWCTVATGCDTVGIGSIEIYSPVSKGEKCHSYKTLMTLWTSFSLKSSHVARKWNECFLLVLRLKVAMVSGAQRALKVLAV